MLPEGCSVGKSERHIFNEWLIWDTHPTVGGATLEQWMKKNEVKNKKEGTCS